MESGGTVAAAAVREAYSFIETGMAFASGNGALPTTGSAANGSGASNGASTGATEKGGANTSSTDKSRPNSRRRRPVAVRAADTPSIMSFFGSKRCEDAKCEGAPTQALTPPGGNGAGKRAVGGGTGAGGGLGGECGHCGSADVVMHAADSMRCCRACDAVEYVVLDNERPVKRDVPRDSTSFSFKRLSHFNEWLAQIQGKDHPCIPENVIGFVMLELKRNYITNAAEIKTAQVRAILKKLKLSRYYEHVPYIIARIRGVPSDRLPAHLEDALRVMFRKIQVPFVKNSPPSRKNFLSYGYVLHKFVQLLGYNEYLEKFPLLKSRDKLRIQDDIWKRICADLGWEFVPSV